MYKKVSLVVIISIIMLTLSGPRVEAKELIIVPNEDGVPIYDNRTEPFGEIGQMRKGEPLIAFASSRQGYWKVKVGNAYGIVKKSTVEVVSNVKVPAKNYGANSKVTILLEKDVDVYDNSSGRLKKFGALTGGYRYPVISDFGNWWKIDLGGRIGFVAKKDTKIDQGVPVLMYHHILTAAEKKNSPYANSSTTMTTTEFYEQMDYLKQYGYTTISTADLESYLNNQINLPAKTVVITLDDGNISSRIYAYPKLKELQFTADQFIITSRMPKVPAVFDYKRLQFLSQSEMDAMSDVYNYYGHTHAMHSLTNKNESYLLAKGQEEVKRDLRLNRQLLNNMTYLAYPFGQYNDRTISLAKQTGITLAYTIKNGRVKLGTNKMLVPRVGIEPNVSLKQFAQKIATGSAVLDKPEQVKPTPPPKPDPSRPFSDVTKEDYFYEGVLSLSERGIISGYPDGSFKPLRSVTRGQVAKILANALQLDMENSVDPGFSDITPDNEYYKPIAALVAEGIISGYPDGTFRENNTLKRTHMAKMLAIGYGIEAVDVDNSPFIDVDKESEYAGYIQALLENNITTGTSENTFSPSREVRRGQLAAFVIRAEAIQ